MSLPDYILCSPESPWNRETHPDARVFYMGAHEVGDQQDGYPGGDIVRIMCPDCGHRWTVELPQ